MGSSSQAREASEAASKAADEVKVLRAQLEALREEDAFGEFKRSDADASPESGTQLEAAARAEEHAALVAGQRWLSQQQSSLRSAAESVRREQAGRTRSAPTLHSRIGGRVCFRASQLHACVHIWQCACTASFERRSQC